MKFWNRPIVVATREIMCGYQIYKGIKEKYGKDTHIFLVRGNTGDIYLFFRLIKEYAEENGINKYVFVGDGRGINALLELFPSLKTPFIPVTFEAGCTLQKLYCFLGSRNLDMNLSLMWDPGLPYNRSTVRMVDGFNYMDSYYWLLLNMEKSNTVPAKPKFKNLDNQLKRDLRNRGFAAGRTVILSPYAHHFNPPILPLFWILLAKDLEMRGYKVFVMLVPGVERNEFGLKEVFFSYVDSKAVLEYAGHFIGLRSGFCDIISEVKCNKVVLYPTKPNELASEYLRKDIEFYGLRNMGLSESARELTMPSARVFGDIRPQTENLENRSKEDIEFIEKILERFPPVKGG